MLSKTESVKSQSGRRPRRLIAAAAAAVLTAVAVAITVVVVSGHSGPDVTVEFSAPVGQVDPMAFSGTVSTYGQDGGDIVRSYQHKQQIALAQLGPGLWRVPLKWNGGRIVSAADGVSGDISGDEWVAAIREFGGTTQIVLPNGFTPADAVAMVRHFAPQRVTNYVLGNEPDLHGIGLQAYCDLFNRTARAMKTADPAIKVAGPAWSKYDPDALRQFLQCAGHEVDIIDYHHYAMGQTALTSSEALRQSQDYGQEVTAVRQMIKQEVPDRANDIKVQVGELNWSWQTADGYHGWNGDDRFYQAVATVWGANVIGHIITAGGIAHPYADQNGGLGLTFEKQADAAHFGRTVGDPMPLYYGELMFTGGKYFRHFGGTVVRARSTLPEVLVFASASPRNVVLVNLSPTATQSVKVALPGVSAGTAAVWQTNPKWPFASPKHLGTVPIHGDVTVSLPPYSVTTLVVG